MIKQLHIIAAAVFLGIVSLSMAEPVRDEVITVAFGGDATAGVSNSTTKVRGQIESIEIDVVTPGAEADIKVEIRPDNPSTMDSFVILATNDVNTDIRFRPRLPSHGTNGVPVATGTPEMYSVVGDTVWFSLTNASAPSIEFKCRIKYRRGN